jgi:hypothetical protein
MEEQILLEIDKDDAPEMSEVLQKKRSAIDDEIQKRKVELDALVSKAMRLGFLLEKLNGHPPIIKDESTIGKVVHAPKTPINGYKTNWSIWDKVKYILAKQIEPVTKRQIIEEIRTMDPRVSALVGKNKRGFSVAISSCLTTKSAKGFLRRIESEADDFRYYLPKGNEAATEAK